MPEIGQPAWTAATRPKTAANLAKLVAFSGFAAACAFVPSVVMWGFSVDDALIPVRYAHNLAAGHGYRFNNVGPITDGVTPLPWAFLLRALVSEDALVTLVRAKVFGVVLWTVAAAALGARLGLMVVRRPRSYADAALALAGLLVMALVFPLGAWAASGLETGLVLALTTIAVVALRRPRIAAALAGVVSTLRPEMCVWAITFSVGASLCASEGWSLTQRTKAAIACAALALFPWVLCAITRGVLFGRAFPLSFLAKPSSLTHGAVYAAAACVVTLTPILACAPFVLARGRSVSEARCIVASFVAHAAAVVLAGGDWMPYARLFVPVAPTLVLAFVALAFEARLRWTLLRLAAAAALGLYVALHAAPAGRRVTEDRAALITRARPVLANARVVAALDVGWISAATNATIVDLAGLTDASIALLPGGHTSKRVDLTMLLDRDVDTIVIYSSRRVVEERVMQHPLFFERYWLVATLPLGRAGAEYAVFQKRPRSAG